MSGFIKAVINDDEVDKLLKKYKKIKRYMKSSIYEIHTMDKNEKIISDLLKEYPPPTEENT